MVGVTTRVTWIGWFRKPLVVAEEGSSAVVDEGTSVVVAVGMFVLINGDTYNGVGVEPVLVETHALCIEMNFYLSNIRQCHE